MRYALTRKARLLVVLASSIAALSVGLMAGPAAAQASTSPYCGGWLAGEQVALVQPAGCIRPMAGVNSRGFASGLAALTNCLVLAEQMKVFTLQALLTMFGMNRTFTTWLLLITSCMEWL